MDDEHIEPPAAEGSIPVAPGLDLAAIAAEHGRWVTSEGKEGKRANLRGLDLSGADMSGWLLVEASLRGTNLTGANLAGADLRAADMAEVVLDNANLAGALLSGASLARAQLHHANAANADFVTSDMTGAVAEGITLTSAKLNGAILRDVNLRHADLTRTQLRDTNLRGATLVEANLSGADLSGADCRDVNFDHAIFTGARVEGANFRNAKLGDVDLQATDFSSALDVASELQTLSLQSERAKVQEEQAQLASWRTAIEAREHIIAEERRRIDEISAEFTTARAEQARLVAALSKYPTGFILRFVLWLIVSVLIVVLTVMRASELEVSRVAGIIIAACLILLLSFMSMLRSLQCARAIKNISASADKIDNAVASHVAEPKLDSTAVQSEAQDNDDTGGLGFGKKKK